VALHSSVRMDESMKVLKENLARHPDDRDTLLALLTFNRDSGDVGAALEYAEQLARIVPNDHDLARTADDLRARLKR
jgi:Flp pilus assembly protein TadD